MNALREDLQVSHGTVSRGLEILERLYAILRVKPFGAPPLRAVKKAQKHCDYLRPASREQPPALVVMLRWCNGPDRRACVARRSPRRAA